MLTAIIVMAAFTAVPIAAFWYFTRKDRSRFEAALTPEERERLRGFCLLQSWQEFIPMTVHPEGDRQIAVAAPADVGERERLGEGGGDVRYSMEELRSKASFCRWKAAVASTELEKDRWRQLADHWRQLAQSSADEADDQQPN